MRGDPIDFGPTGPNRQFKDCNPLVWGARLGILGGAIATVASLSGQLEPSQTVWGLAMGAAFYGWVTGNVWNWLGNRKVKFSVRLGADASLRSSRSDIRLLPSPRRE